MAHPTGPGRGFHSAGARATTQVLRLDRSTQRLEQERIAAVKPDGGGQTGGQMAISELAVYGS